MGYWRLAARAGLTAGTGSEGGCGDNAHGVGGGGATRRRALVAYRVTVATAVAARKAEARTKVALRPTRFVCDRVCVAMGSVSATLGGCAPSGRNRVRWATGCESASTGLAPPGAEGTLGTGVTLGTGAVGVLAVHGSTLGVGVGVRGTLGAGAGRRWLRVRRRFVEGVGDGGGAVGAVGGGDLRGKASRRQSMALSCALWLVVGASWIAEVSWMIPYWRRSSGMTSGINGRTTDRKSVVRPLR